jgi:N-acetylglutamate synthase-like GNAT family acetyltransferase
MIIEQADSEDKRTELDELLWEMLWQPFELPRTVRESLKLVGPQIELIALKDDVVIGALVANWISASEIEIRHLAVRQDFQRHGIGKKLVTELIRLAARNVPIQIQTHARNTSLEFFSNLGFRPRGPRLKHVDFDKHGISFQQMYLEQILVESPQG